MRDLIVGDMHCPWSSRAQLRRIVAVAKRYKPKRVWQVGDIYDFFTFGKYARSLGIIDPAKEIAKGRAQALWFWSEMRRASPRSECIQLRGNHDERPVKRALDSVPELEVLVRDSVDRLFEFPGVKSIRDYREEVIRDGVVFQHGHRAHGDHVRHNGMNTVVGHLHRGGVVFSRLGNKTIWELNVGLVADLQAPAFYYRPQKRFSNWTVGYGTIDADGPRFIPL